MSVVGKYAVVRGIRMFYRENLGDEPVLFIHGNTASSLWFERVMDIPGLHTVAPDMPNFGDSAPIAESDIELYAEYVFDFVNTVLHGQRMVVVGHSLGGAVAMSLALRIPDRIAGLMLVDSCGPGGLITPEEYYPVIEQYKTSRDLLRRALSAVTPYLTDDAFLDRLVDEASRMNPDSFAGNARALARFNCASRTERLLAPVLVLWGAEDVVVTEEMARQTASAFSNGTFKMLANVGHSVVVEDPPRFIALVEEFVERTQRV